MRLAEAVGLSRWSRPGLKGLDVKIAEQLRWTRNEFFVEFGANDGLQQSNTYLLERELKWAGLLVEPLPELAAEAKRNRPGARVLCAAVGSSLSKARIFPMREADLVSRVVDSHEADGYASVVTLAELLEFSARIAEHRAILVSIDVEGFELELLQGFQQIAAKPEWVVVETKDPDSVGVLLGSEYERRAKLSHHDYLWARRTGAGQVADMRSS